jgi:hypothetical protein
MASWAGSMPDCSSWTSQRAIPSGTSISLLETFELVVLTLSELSALEELDPPGAATDVPPRITASSFVC